MEIKSFPYGKSFQFLNFLTFFISCRNFGFTLMQREEQHQWEADPQRKREGLGGAAPHPEGRERGLLHGHC